MIPVPEPKLDHLYQEVILDHNKNPRNFKALADANVSSHGYNPLCGDDYHVYLKIDPKGLIHDASFQGSGCAISKASASIMTTMIKGRRAEEAGKIKKSFLDFMIKDELHPKDKPYIERLMLFEGVKEFPVRVKCATLAWRALEDALKQYEFEHANVSYHMFEKGEAKEMDEIKLSAEMTPNPNTIKFLVNRQFLESGSFDFPTREKAKDSPLALKLFEIDSVNGVLIGTNFITVTKEPHADWQTIAPTVATAIQEFFASGGEAISKDALPSANEGGNSLIEQKIKQILDAEIRPAVARDGGDIVFYGYQDGIVTLHLQGACSSCPSSIMTLKMGVEHRLKQAVPEIKEVVQV
ncbi:MAG: SUF system NifU family Fe-S cluster assembly protein [Candidatus Omnitrophica bacterium]|nr:SUF system NifU family Fe-S cluster assembly protein [Candidatus Omnitrophota bacterium]